MSQTCKQEADNYIAYDGECPMCNSYVHYVRLRDEYGFRLVDLRQDDQLRTELENKGYDLDKGMIVSFDGREYYGADAVQIMADLSEDDDIIKKMNKHIFANHKRSKVIYPFLARGRGLLLRILGRQKFSTEKSES